MNSFQIWILKNGGISTLYAARRDATSMAVNHGKILPIDNMKSS